MGKTPTPLQLHLDRWSRCQDCYLYQGRRSVVLLRGAVPANVLFIGEAPGVSEDCTGYPFTGPAGKIMDRVIERALKDSGISYALTNLVACIPLGDDGTKAAEPDEVCIKSCSSRLKEVIALVSPNLIVCVGALAKRHVSRYIDAARYDMVHITHPAAIIRAPYASQALSIQKAVVTVANAVAKLSRGKEK